MPIKAAEKIYFIYPPVSQSLRVSSLEAFAKDGTINKDLSFYLNLAGVDDQEKAKFREVLLKRAELDPIIVSRFFKTEIGEDILERIGSIINIQGGSNGKYALRGAMVLAALDDEGLSLLNFLRQLPTNIQIDLTKALKLEQLTEKVVKATKLFSEEEIPQLSAMEVADASRGDRELKKSRLLAFEAFDLAKDRSLLTGLLRINWEDSRGDRLRQNCFLLTRVSEGIGLKLW